MFDREGFSVDLMVGGRWWRGFGLTHAFLLQVQCRRCWGTCEKTTTDVAVTRNQETTMAWSTHVLGAGAQHSWSGGPCVTSGGQRVPWEDPSDSGCTQGSPPQPQERPWATALLRTAPGLKCSVSDVHSGKMITEWIWELDLYTPCFLKSTDPLKILPSPF